MKQYGAEFLGTFWLVLGGCGSAVLAAAFPQVGIGLLGVSLAFGLTVLTMAYAIGHDLRLPPEPRGLASACAAGGRFPAAKLAALHRRAGARRDRRRRRALRDRRAARRASTSPAGFASNGYGEHSPGGYSLAARRSSARS